MKLVNFIRENSTAATAKYLDMTTAILFQQVLHIFKELHVPTLVGGNGNPLHVFFNSCFHYFLDRTIMTEVNDLRALALHDPAHDVDSGIVTVKKRSGSYDPDFINRYIRHSGGFATTKIIKLGRLQTGVSFNSFSQRPP